MPKPIIFISHLKVKPGQLDAYRKHCQELVALSEATRPDTTAHLAYASADGTRVSMVHIFPDAEAMEAHMRGVEERAKEALQFAEIASFEIYGEASDPVKAFVMKVMGAGVPLTTKPDLLGGFIRLKPE